MQVRLNSLEDTRRLAESIGRAGRQPTTLALVGALGTGKTQFVRFFAGGLGVPLEYVTSPTYVLLQRYVGKAIIYHFDFYRLDSPDQVWDLGIDELYEQPVWIVIEWADKFPECLPDDLLRIELLQNESGERSAELTATGPRGRRLLNALGP
jgi:tRNA threonylcarbamoyladenosine biosynthesis protein TsaE